jgi:Rieske Fe-S protein
MNRRTALQVLAGSAITLGHTRAQSNVKRVAITTLDSLEADWSVFQYPMLGRPAMLLRVPKAQEGRTLEIQQSGSAKSIFLVSYYLVCTHLGCTPAIPNTDHQLICPCHGSKFWAEDGRAADNRPNPPLKSIQLEVVDNQVIAIESA